MRTGRIGTIMLALLALLACSRAGDDGKSVRTEAAAAKQSPAVATVGECTIRQDDLTRYLDQRPMRRANEASEKRVKDRLEEMIVAEVLRQEALRQKLDQDPEVKQRIQQLLNQKLLAEQVNRPVQTRDIAEAELKAYYDAHLDEFVRSEQVRLADIFIQVPADATDSDRAERKRHAEEILNQALQAKTDRFGFSSLIRKFSDKHPGYRLGDTGFFDRDGRPIGLDPALVEAAFRLERNRDVADSVIETARGFHVIMRVGMRSAVKREFMDVVPVIEQRIRSDEFKAKRDAYINGLRQTASVSIDDAVLSAVVDKRAPAIGASPAPVTKPNTVKNGRFVPPPALPASGKPTP